MGVFLIGLILYLSPNLCNTECRTVNKFVVPLVNAVKELKQENDDLRARLEKLEAKIK